MTVSRSIYTLPNDFSISNEIDIYFYSNNQSSIKNKVVFTKNMICLIQHGCKEVQTAIHKEIISSHEILMLTSGSVLMTESVTENNYYEAILIFFDNKTLFNFCSRKQHSLDKAIETKTIFKIPKDDFLNNYYISLKLLNKDNNTEINELKVQEILGYIAFKHPDVFWKFATQALEDIKNIKLKQVIELNSNSGLTIEELSFLCDMSISTFKRHFASIYGVSPQKYFTQLRMEQAKSLLFLQKRPSEIYFELGYENLSAFSNEFKKHFGISPKQFQKKNERLEKVSELSE